MKNKIISKQKILIGFIIVCFITINANILFKKPLYDEIETANFLVFLSENIKDNEMIQVEQFVRKKFFWISPIIRIYAKKPIYYDISFPFNEDFFEEWQLRKNNIEIVNSFFINNKFENAFCKLKEYNISYYVARNESEFGNFEKIIIFKNSEYKILEIKKLKNINCKL